MDCPNCRARLPDGSTECPGCYIVFSKWKPKNAPAAPPAPAAATECPNCRAKLSEGAAECPNCFIVIAAWKAKAAQAAAPAAAPAFEPVLAPSQEQEGGVGIVFKVFAGILAASWAGLAFLPVKAKLPAVPAPSGSAVISYRSGAKCLVTEPVFEYTCNAEYGAAGVSRFAPVFVFIGMGGGSSRTPTAHQENEKETHLDRSKLFRATDMHGSMLGINMPDLKEMRFYGEKNTGKPGGMSLNSVEIWRRDGISNTIKASENSLIAPDSIGRTKCRRIVLKGSVDEACSNREGVDLTSRYPDAHLTPVRVDFKD